MSSISSPSSPSAPLIELLDTSGLSVIPDPMELTASKINLLFGLLQFSKDNDDKFLMLPNTDPAIELNRNFLSAASSGNAKKIRSLLNTQVIPDKLRERAIIEASGEGHFSVVYLLLENKLRPLLKF